MPPPPPPTRTRRPLYHGPAPPSKKKGSERVRRVEHPITRRGEEREVVAQHRPPEAREVVKEAAAPGGPWVEVELQALPQHRAGDRRARQVTGADVGHVAVVAREDV